jgi:hypothetical protein
MVVQVQLTKTARAVDFDHEAVARKERQMSTRMQLAISSLACLWSACAAVSAAEIFEQKPCNDDGSVCRTISFDSRFPQNLRDISFSVAQAGTAQVSFHGSAVCSSSNDSPAVVDLVTQIVTSQNAVPAINGPGGARHALVLQPWDLGTSDTFNLASTRVLFIPPGQSVISFNVTSLRMDSNTSCVFYNLSFSAVYVER